MSNLKRSILILIPIIIISFCGGYWLNECLSRQFYRDESMRFFIRALHIGQEKGWLTIHYEKMGGLNGAK